MPLKYTTLYILKSVQNINIILLNKMILYHFVGDNMVNLLYKQ